MSLYEYECECGRTFDALRSIANRHSVTCVCGRVPSLKISAWGRVTIAGWDTVIGHDGTVLSRKQSTEQTSVLPERVHGSRI